MADSVQLGRISKKVRAISDFTLADVPQLPDWFTRQFNLSAYNDEWKRWRENAQTALREALAATKELNDLIIFGRGSPEGRVASSPGKIYLNVEGGVGDTLWVKETGTAETGWEAK